jgi:nitrous oxidase accessory protein NosD
MAGIIEHLNTLGRPFVGWSLAMLVQSSVLIALLLVIDLLIRRRVRMVLLHELSHVKRADLRVNLAQALLQIAYFYNPLVWLANWLIRRIREQAVDEAVLVAMGDRAADYPETLVDVARLALARPSLGLRLIGVVENPTALKERIQIMLTRTTPASAQLGLKGLALVLILALVVLPMAAKGTGGSETPDPWSARPPVSLAAVKAWTIEAQQTGNRLQDLVDAAEVGATVAVPGGTYTQPVTIAKALTLKGQSAGQCVLEVTSDGPAVIIDTKGQGKVSVSGLTVKWQLATSDTKTERRCALYVKDTEVSITDSRFVPLGNNQRSPTAVQIEGFSKATVSGCESQGFDYVVCCGKGTDGLVENCVIRDCGHQGIINYEGSTLRVERCVVAGSQFHGLRCTGGTLTAKDNLLMDNKVSSIYLGNKNGRGTITNNLMIHNGSGVAGFYQAEFKVENNVVMDSVDSGIGMWDTCRLTLQNNILRGNPKALAVYAKGGTKDTNTIGLNTYWKNAANTENCTLPADSIQADPLFKDPNAGDSSLRPGVAAERRQGLSNPEVIRTLWRKARP